MPHDDAWSKDQFATSWLLEGPLCAECGEHFSHGQRVWHWSGEVNIVMHADCLKRIAPGVLKDIGECIK